MTAIAGDRRRPVAIARLLSRRVSFRLAALVMIGIITVVSWLAVPLKVTVDGIFYLSSAKSLFNDNFSREYAWFREPGYPVLLRAIHSFGADGMLVVITQALCLGFAAFIALYATRRALGQTDVTIAQLVVTTALVLNPMYLIYSGLVLQQALFALQLALFALGVIWAMNRPARLRRYVLFILVVLNYFAAIWTSVGWIYLGLIPVILVFLLSFWPGVVARFRTARTHLVKALVAAGTIVATLLVGILVYVAGLQVYSGWDAVKAPYENTATIPSAVIEPLSSVPYIPTPVEMTNRVLALMHIGVVQPYTSENDLFLGEQMIPSRSLAEWDTAYIYKPYTSYASGYISLPNPSTAVHFVYAQSARVASVVYSATFVGFMLLVVLALVRRRWKLAIILAVPLAFLAVYAASNSPIDRYGIPAFPWAAAAVSVLLTWLGDAYRRMRRSAPETGSAREG